MFYGAPDIEVIKSGREFMRDLMSEISETHYCAGWMTCLSESLWDAIERLPETTTYGMGILDPEALNALKYVAALIGEWQEWEGPVPLSEWRSRMDSRK